MANSTADGTDGDKRLARLRENQIDLQVERNDLIDEIVVRIRRWRIVCSLLRRTQRLIAYLELRAVR